MSDGEIFTANQAVGFFESKTGERLIGTPEGKAWIVDRVLRSAPVHEPGAAAVYGDLNFITLSALVEEVSKQPFDEFCESRIFPPLGLVDPRLFPLPVAPTTGKFCLWAIHYLGPLGAKI